MKNINFILLFIGSFLFLSCIQAELPNAEADILSCSVDPDILRKDPIIQNDRIQILVKSSTSYDFSDDLRSFSYGIQIGSVWQFSKHLSVFGDLSLGLNNMFKSDFKTITFKMRPVYLNMGAGYSF